MNIYKYRKSILFTTAIFTLVALYYCTKVLFVFDFERFFPQGDDDLQFFYEFKEEFEDDDNFLLIALTDEESIFKQELLLKVDSLTKASSKLESIVNASSITNFSYFVKLHIGGFSPPYPAIHLNKASSLKNDSIKVMQDERIVGNLISKDSKSTVVILKTTNSLSAEASEVLIQDLTEILKDLEVSNYHLLGRAYMQTEIIKQQIKEFIFSTLVSALLVSFIFWFILRKTLGVIISIMSMLVCLIIFVGIIGFFQIELDILSSLFPIIMIIVGVSDVVHLTNKYFDEYKKLGSKKEAIKITVKEIGLATFLTSFTTAIGFLTLMTSRIYPVKLFGLTAALGVVVAFFVVITFTTSLLAITPIDKIIRKEKGVDFWKKHLKRLYEATKTKQRAITIGAIIYLVFCFVGILNISTDVKIYDTLPKGAKVTNDFKFFESNYAGFRPFELAISIKEGYSLDEYEVVHEIHKLEEYLKTIEEIQGVSSITTIYKTMNRAMNADRVSYYAFPESEKQFDRIQKYVSKMPSNQANILVNEAQDKTRISAKVKDVGTDQVEGFTLKINDFVANNINANLIEARITGTGVIFDKNNAYIRQSLISGLAFAFLAISIIMAILFKDVKMVFISLVPNVFPLLFGGALMGYLGIALDAPTAIIFAISFGIAVDDTIHFLSKYKLERLKGRSMEEALETTFLETGKAIVLTSIILFFGFLILLFSKTPGIVFVGILVSGTLFSAVIADLLLIPLMIRKFLNSSGDSESPLEFKKTI